MKQDRHVHVAQKRHLRAPNKQASWTDQGRRHDRHSFNKKFGTREDMRDAARLALGLTAGTLLEFMVGGRNQLVEGRSNDDRAPLVLALLGEDEVLSRIA